MVRGKRRDLFVVHTKRSDLDRATADALAGVLLPRGFTVRGYEDWDWYAARKEPGRWRDELIAGRPVDFVNSLEEPVRPPRQPNRQTIDTTLNRTRAVVFLNAGRNRVTEGMNEELWGLRRQASRYDSNDLFPALLWCSYGDSEQEPYPVESKAWRGKLKIHIRDDKPDPVSVLHVSVVFCALLKDLDNEDGAVWSKAAEELAARGWNAQKFLDSLVEDLCHRQPSIRLAIAYAVSLHDSEPLPRVRSLTQLLASEAHPMARSRAVSAIASFLPESQEATSVVIGALGDTSPAIRLR